MEYFDFTNENFKINDSQEFTYHELMFLLHDCKCNICDCYFNKKYFKKHIFTKKHNKNVLLKNS